MGRNRGSLGGSWHYVPVPPWFDTHVHLDRYAPAEQRALLDRAREADVRVIGVAVDLETARALASIEEMAGHTVGVHPKYVRSSPAGPLEDLARSPAVVAVGECGFDAMATDGHAVVRAFHAQCEVARSLGLPLILHIDGPGAWEDFVVNAPALDGITVVRHYFTGDSAQVAWHRERGHYLSFGNPLRRSAELRDLARAYPGDLLLIETDSYPLPGRHTEPCHLPRVGETLAILRGWTFDEARERLAENTLRAFPRLPRN